ncbi:MAG: AAA family ATPase [Myxococcota bacterium]
MTAPKLREAGPLDQLLAALRPQGAEVRLSGHAGTGKSTLVGRLLEEWHGDPLLLAPTAKAALRLREVTGRDAGTIHATLYGAPVERWVGPDGPCKGREQPDGTVTPPPCGDCACEQRLEWAPKAELEGRLVIVDEASMVGAAVARHLRQAVEDAGGRLLWVGDPGQLPPVGDAPGVDLDHADVHLDVVHRSDRPGIVELSQRVREATDGEQLTRVLVDAMERADDGIEVGFPGWRGVALWRREDWRRMLVVHRNVDRQRINADVRAALGCRAALHRRELLLIRKNDRGYVLNGELGRVQQVEPIHGPLLRVTAEFAGILRTFAIRADVLATTDNHEFERSRTQFRRMLLLHGRGERFVNAQYGYALTCHAAQGSEADEVGVVWSFKDVDAAKDRRRFETLRRWLYTAVTRARRSLTLWIGP